MLLRDEQCDHTQGVLQHARDDVRQDGDEVEQIPPVFGTDVVFGQDVVGEGDAHGHQVDVVQWTHVHVIRD